ncbi:hypothetical protein [Larsenimonas salina]|uniref:hypothetical protein n=1 Tax=Larsenimonas salina TaxID=1295565 RepID=UPI00207451E7|nr:hypothetical protein [Larsenimonas salina]MCM5704402.1 hypothetical protein [Larsenimonas salina]
MAARFEVFEHATAHVQGSPNRDKNQTADDMPLESFRIYDHEQQQYASDEYEIRDEAEEDCARMNAEATS